MFTSFKHIVGPWQQAPPKAAGSKPLVHYGPWQRVSTAGGVHSMFLREDAEMSATDIFVPSMWDEEYDVTHHVEWRKRELRCTPAIGFFAGQELLFVYDEHPERVTLCGEEKPCGRCPPDRKGSENFLRCCLQIALRPRKMSTLPTEALSKSALVPRAAHIAHGFSWPLDRPGFAEAAWKVETFLAGPVLVELHSFGLRLQFRLPADASFAELYHSSEVAFYQHGCQLPEFVLCTMDGSALLPRDPKRGMKQAVLRSSVEEWEEDETLLEEVAATGVFRPPVQLIVHDISGALVADLTMPGNTTASKCKAKLRDITWRHEPGECMNLVLSDGTVWKGVVPLKFSEDPDPSPAEFRLTLVWSSAFQFFAVPIGSGAKIIAGKGVFRETPEREHDVARVGFEVSLKQSPRAGASKLMKSHKRERGTSGSGIGKLVELLPGFQEDDAKEETSTSIHVFELGPEVVQLKINITSDGNQVGGSYYTTVVPLHVSSCVLRSFLSYQFLPGVKWPRLAVFRDKFREVAFKELKTYLQDNPNLEGFTLTH